MTFFAFFAAAPRRRAGTPRDHRPHDGRAPARGRGSRPPSGTRWSALPRRRFGRYLSSWSRGDFHEEIRDAATPRAVHRRRARSRALRGHDAQDRAAVVSGHAELVSLRQCWATTPMDETPLDLVSRRSSGSCVRRLGRPAEDLDYPERVRGSLLRPSACLPDPRGGSERGNTCVVRIRDSACVRPLSRFALDSAARRWPPSRSQGPPRAPGQRVHPW